MTANRDNLPKLDRAEALKCIVLVFRTLAKDRFGEVDGQPASEEALYATERMAEICADSLLALGCSGPEIFAASMAVMREVDPELVSYFTNPGGMLN